MSGCIYVINNMIARYFLYRGRTLGYIFFAMYYITKIIPDI